VVPAAVTPATVNAASMALGAVVGSTAPTMRRPVPLAEDFLAGHDLVGVFEVGWSVLHHDVCLYTAERLIQILADLRCDDRETRQGLDALRMEMTKHWRSGEPWLARHAMDVLAILDMPAWAALLGLIDECPVLHAALAGSRNSRARGQRHRVRVHLGEQSDRDRPRIHPGAARRVVRLSTACQDCRRIYFRIANDSKNFVSTAL
jgi:hypothetical protein